MNDFFAGLDWACQSHAVCVIGVRGAVRERFDISHDASGIAELKRRPAASRKPPVAIECPSGLIVDTLVEAGFSVFPIHPNVVKATRHSYRSHSAKSDASDASLLADLLRIADHHFQPLAPRVQMTNQLRSLLESCWPGAAVVFSDVDSPIALAFIERYPSLESASRLGPKRMAAFCAQHAYSGRRSPEQLLARLRGASSVVCGESEMDANGELARSLARALARLIEEFRQLTCRIDHQVAALDAGHIVISFPRSGRICAAQIVAELGRVRERLDSDARLAAEAGVAPVTNQSGKSKAVTFRWACNHRLSAALTCLADNSRHTSTWVAHLYAQAKARGCEHSHAIRILARAWVHVLRRAWIDRKSYDPAQHNAAEALVPATGG